MLHFPRCLVSVYSATALLAVLGGCSGEPFQTGDFAGAPSVGGTPSSAGASAGGSSAAGAPFAFAGGGSGAGSGSADAGGSATAGSSTGGSTAAGTSAGGSDLGGSGAGSAAMGGSGGAVIVPLGGGAGMGGSAGTGGAPTSPTGVELDQHDWRVSASNTYFAETKPEYAIDADPQSCWASGTPQTPGMWFLVDLHEPQYFFQVSVDVIPGSSDYGRHLKLSTSTDGSKFTPLRTGIEGSESLDIAFKEAKYARYLKLEITADAGGLWWRIDDLHVTQ